MNSRLLELTKFNKSKNELKLELSHLLNSKSGIRQFKSALQILDKVRDRKMLDREITTISNLIFLKDYSGVYSEKYKDFLAGMKMCVGYYEIPRLLQNDQYEQAALLALQEFEALSKNEHLEKGKLAYSLNFFNILKEASKRNDTVIIIQLIDILSKYNLILEPNYSHILANAIAFQNNTILMRLFENIQRMKLADGTLERYADALILSNEKEKALRVLSNIESATVKNSICLKLIASYGFEECMILMDGLISDDIIKIPKFEELPSTLLSIPEMHDYTNLEEKLQVLQKLTSIDVKKIALYSLFASIDNLGGYMGSTVFMINGLRMNRQLLCEQHKDIVFHQVSKFPFKLLGLKFLVFFKELGLQISPKNYLHLLKCQCFGSEFDTLFYVLIQLLEDYKEIPTEIKEFLMELNKQVDDNRLVQFLNINVTEPLANIKSDLNYEFLEKNLESEREREKNVHDIIDGFSGYDYVADIKLVDFLNT